LKKALKKPEELNAERQKEIEVKEVLVAFVAVEKDDSLVFTNELVENIEDIAKQVKAEKIVLYPYAHLSSNLSSPELALSILKNAEEELEKKKYKVWRAPFGYYKEFELKCKGHPLSELSRFIGKPDKELKSKETQEEAPAEPSKLQKNIVQTKLDTTKLKDYDHRIIGQRLGLFMFNESSPGMPYWLPKGLHIYNALIQFWREEHAKYNYHEIMSPLINKKELYLISGHWEHYRENMFIADMGEHEIYCAKPMNCPNAMIVFKSRPMSYKELPYRLSDIDRLHRYELSGTLNGLLRVRSFQQDDSHNFISEDMIESEYKHILKLCERFYGIFGLEYSFRLGTRPEKFIGDPKIWDKAEAVLKKILKSSGKKYSILEGDGAFYGPKVDILMHDSQGREWQMGTIQLDFQLPQRFQLTYKDKEGKDKTPVVIHRVIYGSLERFIGILLEHLHGNLPLWLSPIQARMINFTDRNTKACQKSIDELKKSIPELRIDSDFRSTTLNEKVRDAELMKIPYIIVMGEKEEKTKTVAVRKRGSKKVETITLKKFVNLLKEENEKKHEI
jgi:threonyl-tRNA synthetase